MLGAFNYFVYNGTKIVLTLNWCPVRYQTLLCQLLIQQSICSCPCYHSDLNVSMDTHNPINCLGCSMEQIRLPFSRGRHSTILLFYCTTSPGWTVREFSGPQVTWKDDIQRYLFFFPSATIHHMESLFFRGGSENTTDSVWTMFGGKGESPPWHLCSEGEVNNEDVPLRWIQCEVNVSFLRFTFSVYIWALGCSPHFCFWQYRNVNTE